VTEQAPHFIGIDIGGTNTRIGSFRSLDVPAFTPLARFPTLQDYSTQKKEIFGRYRRAPPLLESVSLLRDESHWMAAL